MPFTRCTDLSAADWLVRSPTDATRLILFGPAEFEAYARLRYIPDPAAPGLPEADVDTADEPSDLEKALHALDVLARFTGTAGDCHVAVWDGYPDVTVPPGPLLTGLAYRHLHLLRGPMSAFASWETDISYMPPAMVWPADRAWFFASDVDPHWAGIGAARAAVAALTAEPGLDVVAADPGQDQPFYV